MFGQFRQQVADQRERAKAFVDQGLHQRMVDILQDDADGCPAQFEIALGRGAAQREDAFDAIYILHRIIDAGGDRIRLFERRVRRQFERQDHAGTVIRRQKAARHLAQKEQRTAQECNSCDHGRVTPVPFSGRGGDDAGIGLHQPSVVVLVVVFAPVFGAHQIGGHQRCDQARHRE
ncbi:hypothetical protein D3C73_532050 [compost metagenome]